MHIHEREIGSIDFTAGQTRTLQLPRSYAYVALNLTLLAEISRSSTQPDGGYCKENAPAQLVKDIEIVANGRDVIKKYDMETLHSLCYHRHGVRPHIYSEALAGYSDVVKAIVKVSARIDFGMWRAKKMVDTLFDSAGLASFDLKITWGQPIDIMNDAWPGTGTDPLVTVHSATLYVSSEEYVGVPAGSTFGINKEWWLRQQVSAVTSNFVIPIPVGNSYREIVVKTHSDGNQVDTILPFGLANQNPIILQSGTEVYKRRIAACLQANNKLGYQMQVPERIGSAAALNHRLQDLTQEGYYILEFCPDGNLHEMLSTRFLSELRLILDVANPGTADFVDVYFTEILLPAEKKA